jgi:hypothetical protein
MSFGPKFWPNETELRTISILSHDRQ